MLFRLVSAFSGSLGAHTNQKQGMDIDSAIVEYRKISPQIFRQSRARYLGSNIVKSFTGKSWFKGKALEEAVKRIVEDRLGFEEKEVVPVERVGSTPLLPTCPAVRASMAKM
jgi:hypothetical protein